ncbi:hypothetical protein D6D21_05449 [Aureobasidium pullulans]|uniref:Uncharacterized protein n=1 Tax=Aureobasidium pullulans TaxID=5580 RepID=A0AB74IX03_AURPU|nr:hypothetical protein D6D21_05449 [Aureobasidium pullulans]
MGLLVEDWYIGVRHGLCFRRFSQVVLLFPRTRLLQDSQSLDFPAAYQFHTTISDSLLPFRYPVVTDTGNPFPIAPVSSKFAALLVVQTRLPTPDAPISRPSHGIANTSGDIWSKSPTTYLHILSHTVFDSSSQRIVAIQALPSAFELQHRLFAKHHRKPSDQDLMAAAEEDAIETILKFETAEEEMRKNFLKQRDKTHGIDERSDISPSDTIHPASMGEESLEYKMLVRERLHSSSRELEELEANFTALMDGVVTLEMDLREAEEKLEKARQKLGKMEEKLNKGWAMQAH